MVFQIKPRENELFDLERPNSTARSVDYKAWVAANILCVERAVASEGAQNVRKALAFPYRLPCQENKKNGGTFFLKNEHPAPAEMTKHRFQESVPNKINRQLISRIYSIAFELKMYCSLIHNAFSHKTPPDPKVRRNSFEN
jgi:hypothetical protein